MTGTMGRPWVKLEHPKPAPVDYHLRDRYEREPGDEPSERSLWWMRQLARGWTPPMRWTEGGYEWQAALFGVYVWEVRELLAPLIDVNHDRAVRECDHAYRVQHVFSRDAEDTHQQVCSKCGHMLPAGSEPYAVPGIIRAAKLPVSAPRPSRSIASTIAFW